jgi:hypothetical protein
VAARITWSDILGIAAGAPVETVQLACQARAEQLRRFQVARACGGFPGRGSRADGYRRGLADPR